MVILRSTIFDTPGGELRALADGALAIGGGRIALCGDYAPVSRAFPQAPVRDLRGGYILPGFIDTHIHFPQVRIAGVPGYSLPEWLERVALPEEASLADRGKAVAVAGEFVAALAAHGTTTAMVFGSHFAEATAALFEAAGARGLRVFSGLVMADRGLRAELHQSPEAAFEAARMLIGRFHGKGRLGYAVTPRFAVSASEGMLEAAGALLGSDRTLRFTTHINENREEIAAVARLFPRAADYLAVYEAHNLAGRGCVLAHSVHATPDEMRRMAAAGTAVAHCPSSNAMLGSGIFPLRRHLEHGVRVALGTDVGAGTGFSVAREAGQAYMQQRVAPEALALTPARMLELATRAGAEALGVEGETGDFTAGKSADLVYLRPPEGSVAARVLESAPDAERALGALFLLTGAESVAETQVAGEIVYRRAA